MVLDVVVLTVVVVVGGAQAVGAPAALRSKMRSSLPSLTAVPPNSVQYFSALSVSTTLTGDISPLTSSATCAPAQTALMIAPCRTNTCLHVEPVGSL
jgi:hypothetical protein